MPLFEVSHSIQSLKLFTALRESALAYPIVLSIHLSSIALFGGTILMTNLRLLGLAMTDLPASDAIAQLRPWKRIGFVAMASSGILLGGAKAEMYFGNPYFHLKLTLLALVAAHALAFRRSVYRNPLPMSGMAKLAACLSLALWLGIISAGRLIAYYEPPGAVPHSEGKVRIQLNRVTSARYVDSEAEKLCAE
jgi:hypothetical protein